MILPLCLRLTHLVRSGMLDTVKGVGSQKVTSLCTFPQKPKGMRKNSRWPAPPAEGSPGLGSWTASPYHLAAPVSSWHLGYTRLCSTPAYIPQENQCTPHSNSPLRPGILVEAKNILMSCWESLKVSNMTPFTNYHFLPGLSSHFHNLQHNPYSQPLTRVPVAPPPVCRSSDVCPYFHSSCHGGCHVLALGRESIPPTSSWAFHLHPPSLLRWFCLLRAIPNMLQYIVPPLFLNSPWFQSFISSTSSLCLLHR